MMYKALYGKKVGIYTMNCVQSLNTLLYFMVFKT